MIETNYDDMLVYLNILLEKAKTREILKDIAISPKGLERIIKLISYAQKQEKLLELYEKLATHRYIVIHNLLDDIISLKEGPNKSLAVDIDYILSTVDDYTKGDIKITDEILKLKELENE